MTPKARPLRNDRPKMAISVDELFKAAFDRSEFTYQRESLLGWRPVDVDSNPCRQPEEQPPSNKPGPKFSNSPDVKVRETSDTIIIEVELPEIREESLFLEVSGDLLIIRAEKAVENRNGSGSSSLKKPPLVHRYVKLPVTAQPGNVQARLNGTKLIIKIGKPLFGIQNTDPKKR